MQPNFWFGLGLGFNLGEGLGSGLSIGLGFFQGWLISLLDFSYAFIVV